MAHCANMLRIMTIALLMQSLPSSATDRVEACPQHIETTQVAGDAIPEGWSAFGTKKMQRLVGVSFFLGPPDQLALLAPEREQRIGKNRVATWTFPVSETAYWVACEYAKTTVVVARALQSDVRECTVEYDGAFSTPVARRWSCRPSSGEKKAQVSRPAP